MVSRYKFSAIIQSILPRLKQISLFLMVVVFVEAQPNSTSTFAEKDLIEKNSAIEKQKSQRLISFQQAKNRLYLIQIKSILKCDLAKITLRDILLIQPKIKELQKRYCYFKLSNINIWITTLYFSGQIHIS